MGLFGDKFTASSGPGIDQLVASQNAGLDKLNASNQSSKDNFSSVTGTHNIIYAELYYGGAPVNITVISTEGFPTAGSAYVDNGIEIISFNYTSKSTYQFIGCTTLYPDLFEISAGSKIYIAGV